MNGSEQSAGRIRGRCLDFVKGIACIGVVFIHVLFPGTAGTVIQKLSQFAVPVFFMASGYYAYREDRDMKPDILRRLFKVIRLTAVSVVFYFLFTAVCRAADGRLIEWLKQIPAPANLAKLILFADFSLIEAKHLWFLPALAMSYLILYFIERKNARRTAYRFLPALFVLKLVVSTIVNTCGLSFLLHRNFLIGGLPWLLLGNYIAYDREICARISNATAALLAAAGAGIAVALTLLGFKVDLSEIGMVIYPAAVFVLAVKNPSACPCSAAEKLGRVYSRYVYVFHIAVNISVLLAARALGLREYAFYGWIHPVITVVLTIAVSIPVKLCVDLSRRRRNARRAAQGKPDII